jgi:hypothetical protein
MTKKKTKKGGSQLVRTIAKEGDGERFINKTLKVCNIFALFLNFIVIIVCIIVIGISWKLCRKYVKTEAEIINLRNKSRNETCKTNEELKKRNGKKRERSYCMVHLEYTVDGKKIRTSVEKDIPKEKYSPGDKVSVYYDKNNKNKVVFTMLGKFFLYLSLIILILTLLSTILRMFYAENTFVKWMIGLKCINTVSDMID